MELEDYVEAVPETQIRPVLRCHGGDVMLNGCVDGVVSVTLSGACVVCPSADLSTRALIEDTLRLSLPQAKWVKVDSPVDRALLDAARTIPRCKGSQ